MNQAIDGANRWTGRCHCADSQFARQHLQREELFGSEARYGKQGSGPSFGDHRRLRLSRIPCLSSQLILAAIGSLCSSLIH